MSEIMRDLELVDSLSQGKSDAKSLFERLGGRATLEKVHKIFYDKLYAHSWLGQFFTGINQQLIESQQTDFFSLLTGGPRNYSGRMPIDAHMHINITEELFDTRHALLSLSLTEAGIPAQEKGEWLKIDMAFKKILVKKSFNDCEKRFATDEIMNILNPDHRKAS